MSPRNLRAPRGRAAYGLPFARARPAHRRAPLVLSDELRQDDRRQLDDAVFELLVVSDGAERARLVSFAKRTQQRAAFFDCSEARERQHFAVAPKKRTSQKRQTST